MRGRFAFAPPPRFGIPTDRLPRFRAVMDSAGCQYDADDFTYTIELTGSPALAANGTVVAQIPFDLDSVFELSAITVAAFDSSETILSCGPSIKLTLVDQTASRALMNTPTPLANIGGFAMTPYILPIRRRFMPGTQLQAILTEYNGEPYSEISLTFHGRKLFTQGMPSDGLPRFNNWRDSVSGLVLCEDLFMYSFAGNIPNAATTVIALGANANNTGRIEVESDFEWIETTVSAVLASYSAENPNGPALMNGVTVNLKDSSTGRYLMNKPVAISAYAGGQLGTPWEAIAEVPQLFLPFVLPQPRIWPAGSQPMLEVTNNNGGALNNFAFTMIGRKIFTQD